jgi:hypothetical protein
MAKTTQKKKCPSTLRKKLGTLLKNPSLKDNKNK